jgi:hypothetical protein
MKKIIKPTKVEEYEEIVELLKIRVPKLFDREPGSYSYERLVQLAEEIKNIK